MSKYKSPVEAIEKLTFKTLQNNTTRRVCKIAQVNNAIIAITPDGTLYSTKRNADMHFNHFRGWGKLDIARIACLQKLGVITKDEMKVHNDEMSRLRKEEEMRSDSESMKRLEDLYNFKFTKSQLKKMNITI